MSAIAVPPFTAPLSVREQALHSGSKAIHGTANRAVLFSDSFKETEHQPMVLRWAKTLTLYAESTNHNLSQRGDCETSEYALCPMEACVSRIGQQRRPDKGTPWLAVRRKHTRRGYCPHKN